MPLERFLIPFAVFRGLLDVAGSLSEVRQQRAADVRETWHTSPNLVNSNRHSREEPRVPDRPAMPHANTSPEPEISTLNRRTELLLSRR